MVISNWNTFIYIWFEQQNRILNQCKPNTLTQTHIITAILFINCELYMKFEWIYSNLCRSKFDCNGFVHFYVAHLFLFFSFFLLSWSIGRTIYFIVYQPTNKRSFFCVLDWLGEANERIEITKISKMPKDYDYLLKVLLVGDSDVGKHEIMAGLEDASSESPFCSRSGNCKCWNTMRLFHIRCSRLCNKCAARRL